MPGRHTQAEFRAAPVDWQREPRAEPTSIARRGRSRPRLLDADDAAVVAATADAVVRAMAPPAHRARHWPGLAVLTHTHAKRALAPVGTSGTGRGSGSGSGGARTGPGGRRGGGATAENASAGATPRATTGARPASASPASAAAIMMYTTHTPTPNDSHWHRGRGHHNTLTNTVTRDGRERPQTAPQGRPSRAAGDTLAARHGDVTVGPRRAHTPAHTGTRTGSARTTVTARHTGTHTDRLNRTDSSTRRSGDTLAHTDTLVASASGPTARSALVAALLATAPPGAPARHRHRDGGDHGSHWHSAEAAQPTGTAGDSGDVTDVTVVHAIARPRPRSAPQTQMPNQTQTHTMHSNTPAPHYVGAHAPSGGGTVSAPNAAAASPPAVSGSLSRPFSLADAEKLAEEASRARANLNGMTLYEKRYEKMPAGTMATVQRRLQVQVGTPIDRRPAREAQYDEAGRRVRVPVVVLPRASRRHSGRTHVRDVGYPGGYAGDGDYNHGAGDGTAPLVLLGNLRPLHAETGVVVLGHWHSKPPRQAEAGARATVLLEGGTSSGTRLDARDSGTAMSVAARRVDLRGSIRSTDYRGVPNGYRGDYRDDAQGLAPPVSVTRSHGRMGLAPRSSGPSTYRRPGLTMGGHRDRSGSGGLMATAAAAPIGTRVAKRTQSAVGWRAQRSRDIGGLGRQQLRAAHTATAASTVTRAATLATISTPRSSSSGSSDSADGRKGVGGRGHRGSDGGDHGAGESQSPESVEGQAAGGRHRDAARDFDTESPGATGNEPWRGLAEARALAQHTDLSAGHTAARGLSDSGWAAEDAAEAVRATRLHVTTCSPSAAAAVSLRLPVDGPGPGDESGRTGRSITNSSRTRPASAAPRTTALVVAPLAGSEYDSLSAGSRARTRTGHHGGPGRAGAAAAASDPDALGRRGRSRSRSGSGASDSNETDGRYHHDRDRRDRSGRDHLERLSLTSRSAVAVVPLHQGAAAAIVSNRNAGVPSGGVAPAAIDTAGSGGGAVSGAQLRVAGPAPTATAQAPGVTSRHGPSARVATVVVVARSDIRADVRDSGARSYANHAETLRAQSWTQQAHGRPLDRGTETRASHKTNGKALARAAGRPRVDVGTMGTGSGPQEYKTQHHDVALSQSSAPGVQQPVREPVEVAATRYSAPASAPESPSPVAGTMSAPSADASTLEAPDTEAVITVSTAADAGNHDGAFRYTAGTLHQTRGPAPLAINDDPGPQAVGTPPQTANGTGPSGCIDVSASEIGGYGTPTDARLSPRADYGGNSGSPDDGPRDGDAAAMIAAVDDPSRPGIGMSAEVSREARQHEHSPVARARRRRYNSMPLPSPLVQSLGDLDSQSTEDALTGDSSATAVPATGSTGSSATAIVNPGVNGSARGDTGDAGVRTNLLLLSKSGVAVDHDGDTGAWPADDSHAVASLVEASGTAPLAVLLALSSESAARAVSSIDAIGAARASAGALLQSVAVTPGDNASNSGSRATPAQSGSTASPSPRQLPLASTSGQLDAAPISDAGAQPKRAPTGSSVERASGSGSGGPGMPGQSHAQSDNAGRQLASKGSSTGKSRPRSRVRVRVRVGPDSDIDIKSDPGAAADGVAVAPVASTTGVAGGSGARTLATSSGPRLGLKAKGSSRGSRHGAKPRRPKATAGTDGFGAWARDPDGN